MNKTAKTTPTKAAKPKSTPQKKELRTKDFLVVGIGASAGGIKALKEFFALMPADSGMAFVVVLHLSPQYESQLAQILQSQTTMPVTQASDAITIQSNQVYVIPPNKNLAMLDSKMVLSELEPQHGTRVAIDLFFRTLAAAYGKNSVCLILSGTGADGTLGLKHIKESHGFAIVQDPDEAEYPAMPQSAIATRLVDWILPIAKMPEKLLSLDESGKRMRTFSAAQSPIVADPEALHDLLTLVRQRSGHDFSSYKQPTLLRRIARHLQIHELAGINAYLELLRQRPEEIQSLIKNLLINVTNFFRDKEVFAVLESTVIPQLFVGKTGKDTLRVWVAACASGEEAFSIGILLLEYAERLSDPPKLQIFASDIDEDAIAEGRQHRYATTIEADVPPERLRRFFRKEGDHYRAHKELREIVLFATHNILRDPPFSKLDLVSCRNLLIYLTPETQEKVLQLFHFVLKPNSFLLLGNSESAEGAPALFAVTDKKQRIYIRRPLASHWQRTASLSPLPSHWQTLPSQTSHDAVLHPATSFGELHYKLIEHYAPPSVLVDSDFEIVHLSESAGRYLRFAGGIPSNNLLKVAHPSLLLGLRTALYTVQQQGKTAKFPGISLSLDGKDVLIDLLIRHVDIAAEGRQFLLVIFEESANTDPASKTAEDAPQILVQHETLQTVLRQVEEELRRTKERLRITIEQHETSFEEHKAANEELQAINEELRSASEELETSKEELQSVNEELTTVNQELKDKIEEIGRTNSDLQNLIQATDIGTIFLDRALAVKRYTPSAQRLFNLIASDIGRPLEHVTHKLQYEALLTDISKVLRTLKPVEREVADKSGNYYLARILPYRTIDDKIQGVVLTFVDINERKQAEKVKTWLAAIVASSSDAILSFSLDGTVISWNQSAEQLFGYRSEEIIGRSITLLIDSKQEPEQRAILKKIQRGEWMSQLETQYQRKSGESFFVSLTASPLTDDSGKILGGMAIFQEITQRKEVDDALRHRHSELENRITEHSTQLATANDALRQEILERKFAESERQHLLHQLVNTQEHERHRIARELHDSLGQHLFALLLGLKSVQERPDFPSTMVQNIQQLRNLALRIDDAVDRLIYDLHPPALDDLGLADALRTHLQEWSVLSGVAVDLHTQGMQRRRLPTEIAMTIYRIVQEALTNVLKHAAANRVNVIVEQRHDKVLVIVEDNGVGFDWEASKHELATGWHLGLQGMMERARLVGGWVDIESSPETGTTLYLHILLTPEANNEGNYSGL